MTVNTNSNSRTVHGLRKLAIATVGLAAGLTAYVAQAATDPVIRGKNDWLYVNYEVPQIEHAEDTRLSIALIGKLNRLLAQEKVNLVVVVVPSKIELYAEHLPDDFKISDYMRQFNNQVQTGLKALGVKSIDLKPAMREAALKNPDAPLFFRLDTHWNPTGAHLAATLVQKGIDADPALKAAWDSILYEKYQLTWASKKVAQIEPRDIAKLLPAGSQNFPPEEVLRFDARRTTSAKGTLTGGPIGGDIVLVGSSFSDENSGFPNAVRNALQRDMLGFYIPGDLGPWLMMKSYLADDAYQTQKPKILIWEIPERAVSWPPNFPHRQARYVIDNTDWLLQASALAKDSCDGANIAVKLEPTGLLSNPNVKSGAPTTSADFIEMSFSSPITQQSYLAARIMTAGSKQVSLEASGPGGFSRKFTVDVAGDDVDHAFKIPLSLTPRGADRLKIYPGNTTGFAIGDLEACRYPADLLP